MHSLGGPEKARPLFFVRHRPAAGCLTDPAGRPAPNMSRSATLNNKEVFESMPVPRALATMAIPTIIGQLIVLIYNMADVYFIGRVNDPYMVGGASLILPVFNISIALAGLVGTGGSSLISRLLGAGEGDKASKVSAFCFYLAIGLAGAFSLVMGVFMDPILKGLGASAQTIRFARQYSTCVIVIGAIPTILSMTMGNLLRSVGCSKQGAFGMSLGGLINIALDPLFMFVLLPRGNEILGAGLATMLSNVIVFFYFLITYRRLRGKIALSLSPREGMPDRGLVGKIFAVGVPASLATLLFDIAYIIIDRLASGYGDIPLAAVGIVLKVERLPLNVGIGLCLGMMPIVGYNYSARNFDRMKKTASFARLVGLGVAAVSVTLYLLFAPQIIRFFIKDPQTVEIGAKFLRIRSLATPFMFLNFHIVDVFQATGKAGRAFALPVVRWAVFNIPLLFILNAVMGMYGIVWTQLIADVLTFTVSIIIYLRFLKQEHLV